MPIIMVTQAYKAIPKTIRTIDGIVIENMSAPRKLVKIIKRELTEIMTNCVCVCAVYVCM